MLIWFVVAGVLFESVLQRLEFASPAAHATVLPSLAPLASKGYGLAEPVSPKSGFWLDGAPAEPIFFVSGGLLFA